VLALRIGRPFFDEILRSAVPSSFDRSRFATKEVWSHAVARSDVRLQWDPDHHPSGAPEARRAIQLGLRGAMLRRLGTTELLEVIDVSEFVIRERQQVRAGNLAELQIPEETVYRPADAEAASAVGLDVAT